MGPKPASDAAAADVALSVLPCELWLLVRGSFPPASTGGLLLCQKNSAPIASETRNSAQAAGT